MTTEDSSPTSLLYITHSIYTFAFTLFVLSATPLPLPSFSDLLALIPYEMASVTASSVEFSSVSCLIKQNQVSNLKKTSLSFSGKAFQSRRLPALRFNVSCAAKPETVDKVVGIVRKQLALADDKEVNGESQFSKLGADSLDTVEIVMGLEEEFGICVEEESAQSISTVQEAADLIESLLEKK